MRRLKAQSIGEYSICVAVIILSLITIQYYLRRGLQGRYADLVDHTTAQISTYSQYEPYYLESYYDRYQEDVEQEHMGEGKVVKEKVSDISAIEAGGYERQIVGKKDRDDLWEGSSE